MAGAFGNPGRAVPLSAPCGSGRQRPGAGRRCRSGSSPESFVNRASRGGGREYPSSAGTAARTAYDPVLESPGVKKLIVPLSRFTDERTGRTYVSVRLTALSNEALGQYCHTEAQKEVWRFPSYPFVIREKSVSVEQATRLEETDNAIHEALWLCDLEILQDLLSNQLRTMLRSHDPLIVTTMKTGRPSYINALLIASRGLISNNECTKNTSWAFAYASRGPVTEPGDRRRRTLEMPGSTILADRLRPTLQLFGMRNEFAILLRCDEVGHLVVGSARGNGHPAGKAPEARTN
ncbi:uncharacterized protein BJX67DRAFT_384925 [Aspergillus lucknowensis]|uniref:Uncharacterized protein n=1 Tax=Aspergillus lucknowensis TaxID=176173 RepID=A0ABR4LF70_9EURO